MAIKDVKLLDKELNECISNNKINKELLDIIKTDKYFDIKINVNGYDLSDKDINYLETKNNLSSAIYTLLVYKASLYKNEIVKIIENNIEL